MQGRHTCLPSPPGRVRTCRFAMQNAALRSTAAAATPKRADSRSAEGAFGSFPHVVAGAAGARHAAAAGADLHAGRHAGLEDHAVVNRQKLGTALNNELVPLWTATTRRTKTASPPRSPSSRTVEQRESQSTTVTEEREPLAGVPAPGDEDEVPLTGASSPSSDGVLLESNPPPGPTRGILGLPAELDLPSRDHCG